MAWTRAGQAVYRGQDFLLLYGGLDGVLSEEAIKTVLFLARKELPVAELEPRIRAAMPMSPEAAQRHILWALKHDLLEFRPQSSFPG